MGRHRPRQGPPACWTARRSLQARAAGGAPWQEALWAPPGLPPNTPLGGTLAAHPPLLSCRQGHGRGRGSNWTGRGGKGGTGGKPPQRAAGEERAGDSCLQIFRLSETTGDFTRAFDTVPSKTASNKGLTFLTCSPL